MVKSSKKLIVLNEVSVCIFDFRVSVCACVCELWGVIGASERLKIHMAFKTKLCVSFTLEPVVYCFYNHAWYYSLNT